MIGIQNELVSGEYVPAAYRLFTIYERKPSLIAAALIRDRVVHHALMNVIAPELDRRFIDDTFACRKGKGVHAAVNRYQQLAQSYEYVLQVDISRYFPSIDHHILMALLSRRLKDDDALAVPQTIIKPVLSTLAGAQYCLVMACSHHWKGLVAFPLAN